MRYIDIVREVNAPTARPWIIGPGGQPLTVYHGTTLSRIHDTNDGTSDTIEVFELETYFAANQAEARSYGDQVYAAHIWMRKPLHTNDYDRFAEAVHEMHELQAQGYDGMIFGNNEQFVVFTPEQVEMINRL